MAVRNPWRGERSVTAKGVTTILSSTMSGLSNVFELTRSETIEGVVKALESLRPDVLEPVFLELADEGGPEVWASLNGAQGLKQASEAILGVIGGLTPEEEENLAKKRLAVAEAAQKAMEERVAEAVMAQMMTRSPETPSGNG